MPNHKLTQEHLSQCLEYNKDTGTLTWKQRPRSHFFSAGRFKAWNSVYPGREAGHTSKNYRYFRLDGKRHPTHRVIFLIMTGKLPNLMVDHKNGTGTDNRWDNLREATPTINQQNCAMMASNTSGKTGVHWHKRSNRWRARIQLSGRDKYIGQFINFQDACDARELAERLYGFSERHGKSRSDV